MDLETKTKVDLSLESKSNDITWDEDNATWDESTGTWDRPGINLSLDAKTKVSLSLETKL